MTGTTFARGVAKTVTVGAEMGGFGVTSTLSGQQLRRTSSDLSLNVQEIQSQEILPSQQVRDSRLGPRQVQGTIAGQLHPTGYSLLFQALLRNTFAAPAQQVIGPMADTSTTKDQYGNLVLVSASTNFGNFLHVGDVVRLSNLTGAAAIDNSMNMRVYAVTGNSVTLTPSGTTNAWSNGENETLTVPGKRLIIPAAGQIDQSLTFEHWYGDVGVSELFTGCKVTQISLNVPAAGFCTMQASVTGQNMVSSNAQHFGGAAAPVTTTGLTATSGQISYAGGPLAYITGMNLQIASQVGNDQVVGSNIVPVIALGTLGVRGSLTALMNTDTMTSDFLAENEVSLSLLLTSSPAVGADFISIHVPRVKLLSSTKNDSDRSITRSYNFVGLENTGSMVGADLTSILMQDSLQT